MDAQRQNTEADLSLGRTGSKEGWLVNLVTVTLSHDQAVLGLIQDNLSAKKGARSTLPPTVHLLLLFVPSSSSMEDG